MDKKTIQISEAKYVGSYINVEKCPPPAIHEYAFIGRSNVGKSSLINMLTDRKKLALTSVKPGKTKTINHFIINKSWYLVDLPGYGYAKISKDKRSIWDKLICEYIMNRYNLVCVFVLIDSRHEPIKSDLDFIEWLGTNQIPFAIVFTKADKNRGNQLSKNMAIYKSELLKHWEALPEIFVTSAETKLGKNEILSYIEDMNKSVEIVPSKK
jgi:GTP-binding protein